jgi:hypothetical protein
MNHNFDNAHRANRLLRWYPSAWRERYGEEFADHLEQEFADRSVDFSRAVNIAYKGLVARVADVGFSNAAKNAEDQTRAAVGTTFVLSALAALIDLNLWSRAMLAWSGRRYHPIPVSLTTGILTVATAALVVVLVAIVLIVAVSVVRQIAHGRSRPLVGPSIFMVVSGALLIYAARWLPRMIVTYGRLRPNGFRWSHPGPAIYGLAQITWDLTQKWIALWNQGIPSTHNIQTVVNDVVPLAIVVFGVAIALLVRRVELPHFGTRLGFITVALLGTGTGVFIISYLVWSAVSGPAGFEYFFPESPWLGVTYLVFMAVAAVLVARVGLLVSRLKRTISLSQDVNGESGVLRDPQTA